MAKAYDLPADQFIPKAAEKLKSSIQQPDWSKFVKTGAGKERLPEQPDWYFRRAASILRTVAVKGPIGVSKLSKKYGNKKNRGHKPEKFYTAGRKVIRTILQQLEKIGYIEKKKAGAHFGRKVTGKGQSFIDTVTK